MYDQVMGEFMSVPNLSELQTTIGSREEIQPELTQVDMDKLQRIVMDDEEL